MTSVAEAAAALRPPAEANDGDGEGRDRRRKWSPTPRRYSTAITLGIVSILMFFHGTFQRVYRAAARQQTCGSRCISRSFFGPIPASFSPAVLLWKRPGGGFRSRICAASENFGWSPRYSVFCSLPDS